MRTGIEALLFLTRGTTDFTLNGVSFATEGVADFMSTTVKIDEQDFVHRLEGYALNGLKGIYYPSPLSHDSLYTQVWCKTVNSACQVLGRKLGFSSTLSLVSNVFSLRTTDCGLK